MRNPLRSEADAFSFLVVVIGGAVVIGAASWLNTWVGVAAAIVVIGGIVGWLMRKDTNPAPATVLVSGTPGATQRVLLVAPNGATAIAGRFGRTGTATPTEVLVVVPALVSTVQSLTGAVDDEREKAQRTADALAGELSGAGLAARGVVGADDTVLAIEDALREFGADEIVLADTENDVLEKARERFALPISTI
jgi:hypothetical protein